jgi:glyoxylase-like metal-dependent hydrolase (beta-lactamase superfamily II)
MFKLDGGAMFGVVPKSIWNKLNPADENNLCTWAMRCLLVEEGNRLILIDTGCGNKQSESFFKHYFLHGNNSLIGSIQKLGFEKSDITDVILTHLHFDHVGGATQWNSNKTKVIPTFPNATYWVDESHWKWALYPNPREKASFLVENFLPIQENNQLKFISTDSDFNCPPITFIRTNGHTQGMLIPKINYKDQVICFMADLLPSVGHIPLPYVMAYDVRPLDAMQEKEHFLKDALTNNYILFFEHDPNIECCTLIQTEKGIRAEKCFSLDKI